jgi:hypothetical protein
MSGRSGSALLWALAALALPALYIDIDGPCLPICMNCIRSGLSPALSTPPPFITSRWHSCCRGAVCRISRGERERRGRGASVRAAGCSACRLLPHPCCLLCSQLALSALSAVRNSCSNSNNERGTAGVYRLSRPAVPHPPCGTALGGTSHQCFPWNSGTLLVVGTFLHQLSVSVCAQQRARVRSGQWPQQSQWLVRRERESARARAGCGRGTGAGASAHK